MVQWADLPPELLSAISDCLQNPTDLPRFRSVCQSWRSSTSPPLSPNIISPLFPRRLSFCLYAEFGCHVKKKYLIAGAVYLLSPRSHPSKSWIVSVQESTPGKLILRHALTHKKIPGSSGNSIDLSEWTVTPISISYSFRYFRKVGKSTEICSICDSIVADAKVVFVSNSPGDCIHNSDAMAVYNVGPSPHMRLCTLAMNGTGVIDFFDDFDEDEDEEYYDYELEEIGKIEDFVSFNGRIYAVDYEAHLHLFDSTGLRLLRMNFGNLYNLMDMVTPKRFVVSDGDLYIVSYSSLEPLQVYKLVMDDTDSRRYNLERVADLGDRVLFITRDSSFSVSGQDLPPRFKRNCVVIAMGAFLVCDDDVPLSEEMAVFHLGDKRPHFNAYNALFTPPSPWINQLRRVDSEKKKKRNKKVPAVVQEVQTTP